jgi:transcriptional regulator with GAF, ATPase, and Fis domain
MRPDWRAALAFYEVSQDAFVSVYEVGPQGLQRRDVRIPVGQLPPRLVRKFFHPSAFFNHAERRSILAQLLQTSPAYEPDSIEAPQMRVLVSQVQWQSCICLALSEHEDVMGLLVLTSEKKNAFGSRAVGEIIPIKSVASMAIAQHLHRSRAENAAPDVAARTVAADFQERVRTLAQKSADLEAENQRKAEDLERIQADLGAAEKNSSEYRDELERAKISLAALEEQTVAATIHLNDAFVQLTESESRRSGLDQTVAFLHQTFQVLTQEHDPIAISTLLVDWFCEHFEIERCTLMRLGADGETLWIAAHCGMDPEIVDRIRVRIGQGVAGWVAHHRKPLFVRAKDQNAPHTGKDTYNSDSFISVPLVHANRVYGVLNLSNKRDGEPFDDQDLDRAQMVATLIAMNITLAVPAEGPLVEEVAARARAAGDAS